jgi:uncharacterized membrane protein
MEDTTRIDGVAHWHLLFGLTFAGLGMLLGIYMAISHNHTEMPAHAHVMLLGFVVSTLYALVYRLWLRKTGPRMAVLQTAFHEVGAVVLGGGLVLMFSGAVSEATVEPLLAVGSLSALAGVVLMIYQVVRAGQTQRVPAPEPVMPRAA